jgi:hypothetical protein
MLLLVLTLKIIVLEFNQHANRNRSKRSFNNSGFNIFNKSEKFVSEIVLHCSYTSKSILILVSTFNLYPLTPVSHSYQS